MTTATTRSITATAHLGAGAGAVGTVGVAGTVGAPITATGTLGAVGTTLGGAALGVGIIRISTVGTHSPTHAASTVAILRVT